MPRSRATEMHQRPSGQGPPSLRTYSDPLHQNSRTERSPRLAGGQSPRGTRSDTLRQKKLGIRIAELESQLGQAQQELKSLKNQLVSAESAKKASQAQLDKKSKKQPKVPEAVDTQDKCSAIAVKFQGSNKKCSGIECGTSDDIHQETDVFEVPVKKASVEPKVEPVDQNELKPYSVSFSTEVPVAFGKESFPVSELQSKNNKINMLKAKLDGKDKELEVLRIENENLKSLFNDNSKISLAESSREQLILKLNEANEELEKSKADAAHMNKKLEAAEKAKQELEDEMRRLHVQTVQWQKAADAAASVLAAEVDMNGRQISERCGSMNKHYGNAYEAIGGSVGLPEQVDDPDDGLGSGKKRGAGGIKMFGDLWKKKGGK